MVLINSKKNKKAFFTITAIMLLSLFLISFGTYSVIKDRTSLTKRVNTLNNFVNSIEEDIPRQIYASGFRIIFLMESKIVENGTYIANFNSSFREAFFNGTLNGQQQSLMTGVTFDDIENSLNSQAGKINANVELSNPVVSVEQDGPWNIKVSLTVNLSINDEGNVASWQKEETYETLISVENFEDPLYVVNTNGLVSNHINQTVYEPFVSGSDVSNLEDHVEDSYYISSALAPSFIDRLQGLTTPSPDGIESLVYLPKLSNAGISVKDKSCVDYIYFSSDNPAAHSIQGMPYWFKLDDNHLDIYGVSGLVS